MEYTIEFGGSPQDVTLTSTGLGDAEGLVSLVRDLISNPRFRPGMLMLEDLSALDATGLTASDVRAQADSVIEFGQQFGPAKLAMIAPSTLVFGLARMWEAYIDSRTSIESRVFYSRAEAVDWLESKRVARLASTS